MKRGFIGESPVPGYDVRILDDGNELPAGETGEIVVKLPTSARERCRPSGNADEAGFRSAYFDALPRLLPARPTRGYIDEDGYVWIMSRASTTSSTSPDTDSRRASMEEVVAGHPDVAECAVFGVRMTS